MLQSRLADCTVLSYIPAEDYRGALESFLVEKKISIFTSLVNIYGAPNHFCLYCKFSWITLVLCCMTSLKLPGHNPGKRLLNTTTKRPPGPQGSIKLIIKNWNIKQGEIVLFYWCLTISSSLLCHLKIERSSSFTMKWCRSRYWFCSMWNPWVPD